MTAQELINSAMRALGELASGETPTTQESNDAFERLNQLLASWSAENLPIPYLAVESFALTGAQSYTIGPSGTFNTARPLRLVAANSVAANGAASPAEVITARQWTEIRDKSRGGTLAEKVYLNPGYPLGTLYVWPKATGSQIELHSYKALAAFPSLSTTVDLPPGYERALIFGLALDLAPEYGRPVGDALAKAAAESKAALAALNLVNLTGAAPPAPEGRQ